MGLVLLEVLAEEWDFSYATDLRTILPCREGRVLSHRVYRFWRDAHGAVREEGTSAQPSGSEESTLAIHRVADFASDHSYFPGWSYQNHQYTSEEIKSDKRWRNSPRDASRADGVQLFIPHFVPHLTCSAEVGFTGHVSQSQDAASLPCSQGAHYFVQILKYFVQMIKLSWWTWVKKYNKKRPVSSGD